MTEIIIDSTKRGFAAMWESGGGMTSGGSATIITGRNGEARRPVYIRRHGHLACGNHALITVHKGFYIVRARVSHGIRSSASIQIIVSVSVKDIDGEKWEATAEVEEVNVFSRGEWDKPLDKKFAAAVEAAFRKASSYHCRSAYYIDTSEKPKVSEAENKRRKEEMRRQDAERAAKRKAKAEREARAKAEAEAASKAAETASKAAKEAGLSNRLEAVNIRLMALEREPIELGESSFKWGWQSQLYSEQTVANVEQSVSRLENEKAEQERKRLVREQFQPKFEAFKPRIEALGLTVEFRSDSVYLSGDYCGQPYSDEGVAKFAAELDKREREAAETRAKADAEAEYQRRKTEAVILGLPTDIRIWRRRGGRTNAGDGWVIGPNGQDRTNTGWSDPHSRRLQRYGEGEMIWDQVLPGEVVLKWSKSSSAAPHKFEVVYLPPEGLTEAQLERIKEIQNELEQEWKDVCGLASGIPSPSVGDGWGLLPEFSPNLNGGTTTIDDLRRKWGAR